MEYQHLKTIKIVIDRCDDYPLSLNEIKYTFETLLTISGFPWRFIRTDNNSSCDIYFGCRCEQIKQAKLNIKTSEAKKYSTPITVKNETFRSNQSIEFLVFNNDAKTSLPAVEETSGIVFLNNDIIFSSFYLLSGCEENFIRLDRKDCHKIQDSFFHQNYLLHTPIVNKYALFLRRLFSQNNAFVPAWPQKKKYAVALSHDVDYPEIIPRIEALRYLISKKFKSKLSEIINILCGNEDFFKFREWLRLEEKYGLKSAFYFCGFSGSLVRYLLIAPDPFYDVSQKKYKDVMRMLDEAGFEVGLHASYYAFQSEQQFRKEKENLENSLGKNISGNRHHYWHMNQNNSSETAEIHRKIGLLYDSSIAFEKASGFRRGIGSPFHLFNREKQRKISILQIPPALMDDHLFGYSYNHIFTCYQDHILSLIDAVKNYEGLLTVDYHVRVLNNLFFPDWGKSYKFLLENIICRKDFYCDTPENITLHCINRERKLLELSKSEI